MKPHKFVTGVLRLIMGDSANGQKQSKPAPTETTQTDLNREPREPAVDQRLIYGPRPGAIPVDSNCSGPRF